MEDLLEKYIHAIHQVLSSLIPEGQEGIHQVNSYALLSSGKRIRPLLFVLCSHLLGKRDESVFRQAAVYEMVHAASLMHDDVLDNAQTRRHRPSVNALWGNQMAVLCGDHLYINALKVALETHNLEYLSLVIDTVSAMTEGQVLELQNYMNLDLKKDTYLKIIGLKTATLLGAACKGAAILAGVDKALQHRLWDIGYFMGIAFQLIDDLLDYIGKEEVMGKPPGKDLMEGKVTLPLIYLLEELAPSLRALVLEGIRTHMDQGQLKEVITLINENGIPARVIEEAEAYCMASQRHLKDLPPLPERDLLLKLCRFIVARQY